MRYITVKSKGELLVVVHCRMDVIYRDVLEYVERLMAMSRPEEEVVYKAAGRRGKFKETFFVFVTPTLCRMCMVLPSMTMTWKY
jgi:hypothetical protein